MHGRYNFRLSLPISGAGRPYANERKTMKSERLWVNAKSLLSTVAFVWLFTNHIAQATVVPTESMSPTILVGDHFMLDKVAFPANYPHAIQRFLPARDIERGEILAFWPPDGGNLRLIKRVIGLPGETVEMRGKDIFINGVKLDEPYAVFLDVSVRQNYGPITVPPDSFFMMGDNRDNSRDSRFFGPARRQDLIGRPLFVYWSFETEPYGSNMTVTDWAVHYADVALHFFSRSRWSRTGTVFR
jgi:signal peptidase I